MRLAIDAVQHKAFVTGTERAAVNVLRELQELDDRNEYVVFVNERFPYVGDALHAPNFVRHPVRVRRRDLWAPLAQPVLLRKLKPDVCFSFYNMRAPLLKTCRTVVSLLDLSMFLFREEYRVGALRSRVVELVLLTMARNALRSADAFVANSEFTKDSFVRRFSIPPSKIQVAPLQADEKFFEAPDAARLGLAAKRYRLPERFVLTIGGSQPRKNVERLVEAHRLLPDDMRAGYPLVVVGARWGGRPVAGDVVEAGIVDDDDLPSLYRLATVFVYPSLYEGFGLPVLEAMASGTPVVAARATSLPEVGGDAAVYVDPTDPDDIAGTLRRVLADASARDALTAAGRERVRAFSWRRAARAHLAAFESAASPSSETAC